MGYVPSILFRHASSMTLITPHSDPRGLSHILNPTFPGGDITHYASNGSAFKAYEENGRLYHAWRRGTYPFPTDDVSQVAVAPAANMKLT